jgi:hypothetical protein
MEKIKVHISVIRIGDTVEHNGIAKTVCSSNLTYDNFNGFRLWGDSYNLGYKPVTKILFK